ncbi:MAG: ribbon-helix-helix protein, CopG family [Verrucomicrobia bacterium]|nr:MAG: ribbon-helix-helix protein, CopG family [Verrucomicrobiota bacterium]
MKRTLVDLEEHDLAQLDALAGTRQTSRASLLREAVSEYLVKRERVPANPPKPLEGFGAISGRLTDGLIYQDKLRSEWD